MADYGVRKYDSFTGRFLTPDVLFEKYPAWNPYHYSLNNPLSFKDDNGKDAVFVTYPEYTVGYRGIQIPGLGHAGVLLIDNKTGETSYFAFGRYENEADGKVHQIQTDKVDLIDGKPTASSLNNVLNQVSEVDGEGSQVIGAYYKSDRYKEMKSYAESQKNNKQERKPYNILLYNCGTWAFDVISQDKKVKMPSLFMTFTPLNMLTNAVEGGAELIVTDPNTTK